MIALGAVRRLGEEPARTEGVALPLVRVQGDRVSRLSPGMARRLADVHHGQHAASVHQCGGGPLAGAGLMTDHLLAILGGLLGGAVVAVIAYVHWLRVPDRKVRP